MLYRTIQKKSIYLEKEVIAEIKCDQVKTEKVALFIDLLTDAIPLLYNIENYNSAKELFQKWKVLYFDFCGKSYDKKLKYTYSHDEISNKLISEQLLTYLRLSLFKSDYEYSCNKEIIDLDKIINFKIATDSLENFESAFKADSDYKKSNLDSAVINVNNIIQTKTETKEDAPPNTADDAIYIAWAIHMLGNIYNVKEMYSVASTYYKESLIIKDKIISDMGRCSYVMPPGFLYYSFYNTKLKYIASTIERTDSGSLIDAIEQYKMLKEKIESSKAVITKSNNKFYNSLDNIYNYNLAKMYYYYGDDTKSVSFLDTNIKSSQKINDNVGTLRGALHKSIIENAYGYENKSNTLDFIEKFLLPLSTHEKNNPIIKALIGKKHLLEYEFLLGKKGFGGDLTTLFNSYGISAHKVI